MSDSNNRKKEAPSNGKNLLEWAIFGISCVLVAGTIAVLAFQAASGPKEPARLEVKLGEPEERNGWLSMPVEVANRGGRAAENVRIEVRSGPEANALTAACAIDFVPASGTREAAVVFPAGTGVEAAGASVVGYAKP